MSDPDPTGTLPVPGTLASPARVSLTPPVPGTPAAPSTVTHVELARQATAEAAYEARMRAGDPPPASSFVVKDIVDPNAGLTGVVLTSRDTLVGGTKPEDNNLQINQTLKIGQEGQFLCFTNLAGHQSNDVDTPLGSINFSADAAFGVQTINGRTNCTYDNTVTVTGDLAGDTDHTGLGFVARVEDTKDASAQDITGDPSKKKTAGLSSDAGLQANFEQKVNAHLTVSGSAFAGIEGSRFSPHPYAEASLGADGRLPNFKHKFSNGTALGAINTGYHVAALTTTHGAGWEASVGTTVVQSKIGDFGVQYQGSGGPGSTTFGVDKGVPNNGV